MTRPLMTSLLVLLCAALILPMPSSAQRIIHAPSAANAGVPEVGQPFPPITGPQWDGKALSLADYRGKVVLLDFWATWCGPCIVEMPMLKRVYARYQPGGFEIIGISLDESPDKIREWYADEAKTLPWPTIVEGGGWSTPLARRFGVRSIPFTVLIDREGKVAAVNVRGHALYEAVATLVDPDGPRPPRMAEQITRYGTAQGEARTRIESSLLPWAAEFQRDINRTTWGLMTGPVPPKPEDAAFYLKLLEATLADNEDYDVMDTAALAAWFAGDTNKAVRLQQRSIELAVVRVREMVRRMNRPNTENLDQIGLLQEVGAPEDTLARLALYHAGNGSPDASVAILDRLKDPSNRYHQMARAELDRRAAAAPSN